MFGGHPPALCCIVGRSKGTHFFMHSKQKGEEIAEKYTLGYQVIVIALCKFLIMRYIICSRVITTCIMSISSINIPLVSGLRFR